MPIAFDAASGGHNGGSGNYDLTTLTVGAGSNRALVVGITTSSTPAQLASVVWDPVGANQALSQVGSEVLGPTRYFSLWYLNAPASGNKILRINNGGVGSYILMSAASYTGVSQSGQPEANTGSPSSSSPKTVAVTVITADAWLVMVASGEAGSTTAGTSTTYRGGDGFGGNINAIMDSNAGVAAGSRSLQATSGGDLGAIVVALAPAGGAPRFILGTH